MKKGKDTRHRILDRAFELATRDGLEGVTIGTLSRDLRMSKSGLFAHFRSKVELQRQILQTAHDRFREQVIDPVLEEPPGKPRLDALIQQWMSWIEGKGLPGGCLFLAASGELDDQRGKVREMLVRMQLDWRKILTGAARQSIEVGHLAASSDPEQIAFELLGVMAGFQHALRLLGDRKASGRARAAVARLLEDVRS